MNTTLRPGVAAVAAAAIFIGSLWLAFGNTATAGTAVPVASPFGDATAMRHASETCSAGDLLDDDHTLLVDVGGDDYGSGDDIIDGLACVLETLDAPASVAAQMDATRALDGMRTAEWDDYRAQWTYHPDEGIDVILTIAD